MIPSKIKKYILSNALFQLDDHSLIESILNCLSELTPEFRNSHSDQIKRFSEDSPNDISAKKTCVNLLFGQFIDLSELETKRIHQLEKSKYEFPKIKSIKKEMVWLSGGLTVNYIDQSNSSHIINLEYPIDQKLILPHKIIGGLYLDNELVPVRSKLENEIIVSLQSNSLNRASTEIKRIIEFVNSYEYIRLATEIGRIK